MFEFFVWCESTAIGTAVRNSIWAFPIIEAVHLLGLGMLGGAVLIVDLRMMGTGLTGQSVSGVQSLMRPWLVAALAIMILTGVPMFLSEALKCYYNTSFWVKMVTLPVAVAFAFVVRDRIARTSEHHTGRTRVIGVVSLSLWVVVAAAGRWIGYS